MKVYSVSEFRQEVNELLGEVNVAIAGEIADFHIAQNRFVWFSLVDAGAVLSCFMLTFQLREPLADGMMVRLVGTPTIFKKGQFVFRPRQVEIIGEGSLQRAYELLRRQLSQEGLFAEQRKRPLPRFPQKVGLITSADAAAYTDVLRILKNRWAGLEIKHVNVQVQGEQAVTDIVGALVQLNEDEPDLDCIILTRGGGSLEDLRAFNAEEVVRAIFASRVPVVCGIGHERDVTLADLTADLRAATPSNAAESVVPDKRDVLTELSYMMERCRQSMQLMVQERQQRVQQAILTIEHGTRTQLQLFTQLSQKLLSAYGNFEQSLSTHQERLAHTVKLLCSFHPQHVLARGYSITRNKSGVILTSIKQIKKHEDIITTLNDGKIKSKVY